MKKLSIILSGLVLTGCMGYKPIYAKNNADISRVSVESVTSVREGSNIGRGIRRNAQSLSRQLSEVFSNTNGEYLLHVNMDEDKVALAVQRDARDERIELILGVKLKLVEAETNKTVLETTFETTSPYNIQSTPHSTESGIERARQSATTAAGEEVIHRVSMFLNQVK